MAESVILFFVVTGILLFLLIIWPNPKKDEGKKVIDKTIPFYNISHPVEAALIIGLLKENDIRYIAHRFNDFAYTPVWEAFEGWGFLRVFEKDKAKAEGLIKNFLNDKTPLDLTKSQSTEGMPRIRRPYRIYLIIWLISLIINLLYLAIAGVCGWISIFHSSYSILKDFLAF